MDENEEKVDPMAWLEQNGGTSDADREDAAREASAELEPDDEADDQEAGDDSEAEGEPEAEGDSELGKAKEAIARKFSGTSAAMLKGMSDEQVLALGTQIAADTKKYTDQANKLDRLNKGQDGDRHEDDDGQEHDAGDGVRPSDGEADGEDTKGLLDLKEVLGTLDTDIFGEDLPKALAAISDKTVKHLEMQINSQVGEQFAQLKDQFTGYVDGDVRRQLAERFPQLQDPKVVSAVDAAMKDLAPGMTYADPGDLRANRQKLMEHALVVVDPNAFLESKGKTRRKGGPVPPKRKPASGGRKLSDMEKKLAFLNDLERTGDLKAAQRILNS